MNPSAHPPGCASLLCLGCSSSCISVPISHLVAVWATRVSLHTLIAYVQIILTLLNKAPRWRVVVLAITICWREDSFITCKWKSGRFSFMGRRKIWVTVYSKNESFVKLWRENLLICWYLKMQVMDKMHSECLSKEMMLGMQYWPSDTEGPNLPKCTTIPVTDPCSGYTACLYQLMLPFLSCFSCLISTKSPSPAHNLQLHKICSLSTGHHEYTGVYFFCLYNLPLFSSCHQPMHYWSTSTNSISSGCFCIFMIPG